jgi:hypothetical protein
MSIHDALFAYSAWLDGEGLVKSDRGEGTDKRTHDDLAAQFLAEWSGLPLPDLKDVPAMARNPRPWRVKCGKDPDRAVIYDANDHLVLTWMDVGVAEFIVACAELAAGLPETAQDALALCLEVQSLRDQVARVRALTLLCAYRDLGPLAKPCAERPDDPAKWCLECRVRAALGDPPARAGDPS